MHSSTMTHNQREILVHTLSQLHPIENVARLTDEEIEKQWLFDCEYGGGKDFLKTKFPEEDLETKVEGRKASPIQN